MLLSEVFSSGDIKDVVTAPGFSYEISRV